MPVYDMHLGMACVLGARELYWHCYECDNTRDQGVETSAAQDHFNLIQIHVLMSLIKHVMGYLCCNGLVIMLSL